MTNCIDSPILLSKSAITSLLQEKSIAVDVFESIDSTNAYVKKFMGDEKIHVCVAEEQTQGRGRFNRSWHSPFGQNIYFSMLYPFKKDLHKLEGLSFIVSVCLVKTLEAVAEFQKPFKIKWPNDIVCEGKKLAGILIEVGTKMQGYCEVIIGIGINVNMNIAEEKEITQAWTSLQQLTNQYFDRNQIIANLMDALIVAFEKFAQEGLSLFLREWQQYDALFGKAITLQCHNETVTGVAQGINEQGHLKIQLPDGEIKAFSSGDTSIVKK